MEFLLNLIQNFDIVQALDVALKVIAAAAILATLTPSPKDDGYLAKLKKLLDVLAMNVGKAKNKEE